MILRDSQGYAVSFDTSYRQNRWRHLRRIQHFLRLLKDLNLTYSHAMELGPGANPLWPFLAKRFQKVTVLDRDPHWFGHTSMDNVYFFVADFFKSHLPLSKFELVCGFGFLHHVWWNSSWAYRLADLLQDQGWIIFLEPNPHNPMARWIFQNKHLRRLWGLEPHECLLSLETIENQLQERFQNIFIRPFDLCYPGWIGQVTRCLIHFESSPKARARPKIPGYDWLAQSCFIVAQKKSF